MLANFIITSGDLFGKENVIYENWIQGKKFALTAMDAPDIQRNLLAVFEQPAYRKVTDHRFS
jgi:hypothetical protein